MPRPPDVGPTPEQLWDSIKGYPWAERRLVPGLDQEEDRDPGDPDSRIGIPPPEVDDAGPAHRRLKEDGG